MKNNIQTAVIIEDEPLSKDALEHLLKQNFGEVITISGYASRISEAVNLIEETHPDIVFSDIKLVDGTAFDYLQKINYKSFHLIFVTAYGEFALNAFKYSAIDYILKPVSAEDLDNALGKLNNIPQKSIIQEQIEVFKNNLYAKPKDKAKLILPTLKGIFVILISEIVRLESNNVYTTFFTADKKSIMVSKPLNYYEELLIPFNFFRVHQSHLINLDFIASYSKTGIVQLKDQEEIPVALKRREQFVQWLNIM